jgi:hypothetical protein
MSKVNVTKVEGEETILKRILILIYVWDQFKSLGQALRFAFDFLLKNDEATFPAFSLSERELCEKIDAKYNFSVKKTEFYEITGLSKNSFNKYFEKHLKEKGLMGRRAYTMTESYDLIGYWQGEGEWMRFQAFGKQEVAEVLHKGKVKQLASEFKLFIQDEEEYKRSDKFSPRLLKLFLHHVDCYDEEILGLLNQD